jgi:hypothetical protein
MREVFPRQNLNYVNCYYFTYHNIAYTLLWPQWERSLIALTAKPLYVLQIAYALRHCAFLRYCFLTDGPTARREPRKSL